MKTKVALILFITILVNVFFWPNQKYSEKIDRKVIEPIRIVIELEGEVSFPGKYTFTESITLREIINYAGSFTLEADASKLDLNEKITKNRKIIIDKKNSDENNYIYRKLNINDASFIELINIPNITETRAANIILYREQNGLFASLEDLLKVKYIGNEVYKKIIDYLTVW